MKSGPIAMYLSARRSFRQPADMGYNLPMSIASDQPARTSSPAPARIKFEVGDRTYIGDLYLPGVDFRNRVSDVLNEPQRRFLPLLDVEQVDPANDRVIDRRPFMLIRIDLIDVVVPLIEPGEAQAASGE